MLLLTTTYVSVLMSVNLIISARPPTLKLS